MSGEIKLEKSAWIEAVYQEFCKKLGAETPTHHKNLREWAELMVDTYFDPDEPDDYTPPEDAVWEEIQAGL